MASGDYAEFLAAANEMLDEHGQPLTVVDAEGTAVATAQVGFLDYSTPAAIYFPDGEYNAGDEVECLAYMKAAGTVSAGNVLQSSADGNYRADQILVLRDGGDAVLKIVRCHRTRVATWGDA